jgi:hypothetical protein
MKLTHFHFVSLGIHVMQIPSFKRYISANHSGRECWHISKVIKNQVFLPKFYANLNLIYRKFERESSHLSRRSLLEHFKSKKASWNNCTETVFDKIETGKW